MTKIVSNTEPALLIIRSRFPQFVRGVLYYTERPSSPSAQLAEVRAGTFCVIIPDEEDYGHRGIVCYYHVFLADNCKSGWIRASELYYA